MPVQYTAATADLGILEGRLTAARAAALDELLAGNLPTDVAANLTAIQLNELEADALARANAILANQANIETDTIQIGVDTAGLAGAAMRGTDGVDVAAMRGTDGAALAAQFDNGYTEENIAQGAALLPDDGLIVTGITSAEDTATLSADNTHDNETVMDSIDNTAIVINDGKVKMVFMACDGSRVVIDNTKAGASDIGIYWFKVK